MSDSVADWTFANPGLPRLKLDDAEWHHEAAKEAGANDEAAGAHIAYFLGWAAERDALLESGLAGSSGLVGAVRRREPGALLRLLHWYDDKLFTTSLAQNEAAFAQSCYSAYLRTYEAWIAEAGEPRLHEPTWVAHGRVSAGLDALFEQWEERGCS